MIIRSDWQPLRDNLDLRVNYILKMMEDQVKICLQREVTNLKRFMQAEVA